MEGIFAIYLDLLCRTFELIHLPLIAKIFKQTCSPSRKAHFNSLAWLLTVRSSLVNRRYLLSIKWNSLFRLYWAINLGIGSESHTPPTSESNGKMETEVNIMQLEFRHDEQHRKTSWPREGNTALRGPRLSGQTNRGDHVAVIVDRAGYIEEITHHFISGPHQVDNKMHPRNNLKVGLLNKKENSNRNYLTNWVTR